ncbi:hypothetical protein DL96DRAFT_474096 [Flagelloscypha sp. PMI_526]|nr:hypothetical protein DL96DRAFT_474096 [Flagelloscypha sp. PMI_526]
MRSHRYRDDATPSAAPTVFKRGYIQVLSSDGNTLHGYVAATSSTGGIAGVTTSQQSAMVVQYDSTSVAPYNLEIVNGQNKLATYPYLALVQGPVSSGNNGDFGSGTYNYAIFTAGNSVPKGSTPSKGQNSFSNAYAYETAVFTVDSSQNVLATWINTNGGIPTTYFVWAPTDSVNFLAATGDVPAYQSKWPGRPQVLLKFVETA